jgi:tetratricopeptide (TPR) repeat protein
MIRKPRYPLAPLKGLVFLLVWGLLSTGLFGAPAAAGDTNYYPYILRDGKLQRFNDQTRVIYYRLDTLSGSSGWDYTKWNFLKDEIVKGAFQEWERALNGRITFKQTTDPKQTDIAVHWRNNFNGTNLLGLERPGTLAGGTILADADIQLTLTFRGKQLNDQELKAVAIHEIGHALGINGHSPYPKDIMYSSIQPGVTKLSSRDIQTIQMIYANKPDITNPYGVHLVQYREALESFQKGVVAYNHLKKADAYKAFVKAYNSYPVEPTYAMMAGLSAYEQQDFTNAIAYLGKAVPNIRDKASDAKFYLADAYFMQSQVELQRGNAAKASEYLKQSNQGFTALMKDTKTPAKLKQSVKERQSLVTQRLGMMPH